MADDVLTELTGTGVLLVTLNRPERLNTIGGQLRDQFHDAMERARLDAKVRVVAITGAGRAFCGGADLGAATSAPDGAGGSGGSKTRGFMDSVNSMKDLHRGFAGAVYECPKPTVALVNGAAAGGGFGMCLAADFRIASEEAFFVSAFAKIALAGDNGVTYGLQRLLGRSRALEILMLSPRVTAAEALELGLVRSVVPSDQLLASGMEFCDRLAAGPTSTYALMKANMAFIETATYQEGLDRESVGIGIAYTTPDAMEAMTAFMEKRPPKFS
jgi:2-(1,2-epoxy-1,2-dihydrophenyl)acetyl-CoA isomerase